MEDRLLLLFISQNINGNGFIYNDDDDGFYDDGGANDWLNALAQIRDEPDEDEDEFLLEQPELELVVNGDSQKQSGWDSTDKAQTKRTDL